MVTILVPPVGLFDNDLLAALDSKTIPSIKLFGVTGPEGDRLRLVRIFGPEEVSKLLYLYVVQIKEVLSGTLTLSEARKEINFIGWGGQKTCHFPDPEWFRRMELNLGKDWENETYSE